MNEANNKLPADFTEFEKLEQSFLNEEPDGEKDFILEDGIYKVLLSAPHSVSQLRNGKIKAPESRTGTIIILLRERLGTPIIYKTRNENNDANFDEKSNYRDELIDFLKNKKIGCVLDFHISAPSRPYSVEVGTGYGENICGRKDLQEIITEGLKKTYNEITVDSIFPASNPNTVSASVGNKAKIPAFQIEINWNVISDYDKMLKFVDCFEEIIKKLEENIETVDNI
ncbi:MAG: hypothetical protein ACTTKY_09175 [Catonella sp.]